MKNTKLSSKELETLIESHLIMYVYTESDLDDKGKIAIEIDNSFEEIFDEALAKISSKPRVYHYNFFNIAYLFKTDMSEEEIKEIIKKYRRKGYLIKMWDISDVIYI